MSVSIATLLPGVGSRVPGGGSTAARLRRVPPAAAATVARIRKITAPPLRRSTRTAMRPVPDAGSRQRDPGEARHSPEHIGQGRRHRIDHRGPLHGIGAVVAYHQGVLHRRAWHRTAHAIGFDQREIRSGADGDGHDLGGIGGGIVGPIGVDRAGRARHRRLVHQRPGGGGVHGRQDREGRRAAREEIHRHVNRPRFRPRGNSTPARPYRSRSPRSARWAPGRPPGHRSRHWGRYW